MYSCVCVSLCKTQETKIRNAIHFSQTGAGSDMHVGGGGLCRLIECAGVRGQSRHTRDD